MADLAPERTSDLQIAALLGALGAREETAGEIAGFADAMRSEALSLPLTPDERSRLVDTCGTGGDASGTFNISTAAALVAAAAGATVAKHGNRAVTSKCGSADVLEALGVPVNLTPEAAADSLRRNRFAFLHAPSMHPAMRAVMPVRRALGVRTLFNVIGPLTNPAGASRQVMGVFAAHLVPIVAEAMVLLGTRRGLVVYGSAAGAGQAADRKAAGLGQDRSAGQVEAALAAGAAPSGQPIGLDELSLSGPSQVAEVRDGVVTHWTVTPGELDLAPAPLSALAGDSAETNAGILRGIFAGEPGPAREITVLNAAAVLLVADCAVDLSDGIRRAQQAIDTGGVTELLASLARTS